MPTQSSEPNRIKANAERKSLTVICSCFLRCTIWSFRYHSETKKIIAGDNFFILGQNYLQNNKVDQATLYFQVSLGVYSELRKSIIELIRRPWRLSGIMKDTTGFR